MIRVELNGESKALENTYTLEHLIRLLNLKNPNIAVAINFDVVPRSQYSLKTVKDGDKIDIIHPVGGG